MTNSQESVMSWNMFKILASIALWCNSPIFLETIFGKSTAQFSLRDITPRPRLSSISPHNDVTSTSKKNF